MSAIAPAKIVTLPLKRVEPSEGKNPQVWDGKDDVLFLMMSLLEKLELF